VLSCPPNLDWRHVAAPLTFQSLDVFGFPLCGAGFSSFDEL
jgi:hypothetical protein